jgi:hypothetical protein
MELSDAPEKIPSDRGSIPQCLNHYATPGPYKGEVVHLNAMKK